MRQYNDWEEIDKDTNGLVTSLTYMILFVNDQVYNYTVSLMEAMRNSEHYRHNAKRTANAIEKEIDAYNTNIFRIAKANKEAFARDYAKHGGGCATSYRPVLLYDQPDIAGSRGIGLI